MPNLIGLALTVAVGAVLLATTGSRARSPESAAQQADRVEMQALPAPQGETGVELQYGSGAGAAHFGFRYASPRSSDAQMPVVRASLWRRPDSHPQQLLEALAHLHGGKTSPHPGLRLDHLDITAAVLGHDLSHGPGRNVIAGEFTTEPAGDWIVFKLFLDTPDEATTNRIGEPAEIFLAVSPSAHVAWFLVKDPEYWPELDRVLASVL